MRCPDLTQLPHVAQFARGEAGTAAPATVRNHTMALVRFGRWLANNNDATAATVTALQLDSYRCDLLGAYPHESANVHLSACRRYLRWLRDMGLRRDDPKGALPFVKPHPPRVEALSVEEVGRLVQFAARSDRARFGVARTAHLLLFLCESGLRVGEALSLKLGDLSNGQLRVHAAKTRSVRTVPISPAMRDLLQAYLARRQRHLLARGRAGSEWLWCGEHGGRWTTNGAARSCRTVARLAGLRRRCYPHLLRHTFATLSLINGLSLPGLMLIGGWSRLSTVQRYAQMSTEQLAEAHAASSPLAHARRGQDLAEP